MFFKQCFYSQSKQNCTQIWCKIVLKWDTVMRQIAILGFNYRNVALGNITQEIRLIG